MASAASIRTAATANVTCMPVATAEVVSRGCGRRSCRGYGMKGRGKRCQTQSFSLASPLLAVKRTQPAGAIRGLEKAYDADPSRDHAPMLGERLETIPEP